MTDPLLAPLSFRPVYQRLVWGGRRMAQWRDDLPEGPIGESWDLADHEHGMSVVADGPLAGITLGRLARERGHDLIGPLHDGGDFPVLVKLIDANARLSVQVHPDDELTRELGVGVRGKTECWLVISEGGEIFQGTRRGTTRESFEAALAGGPLEAQLNRFVPRNGDFFFIGARTVHALGAGTLLYEIQQTCDVTFRVHDWGRVGLDGRPRETHIAQSLRTIDFGRTGFGPVEARESRRGSATIRHLHERPYFAVQEARGSELSSDPAGRDACSIVVCLDGRGVLQTACGEVGLWPMQTRLVPAVAGGWHADSLGGQPLRLLLARPVWPTTEQDL